jgi:hypothetical protein
MLSREQKSAEEVAARLFSKVIRPKQAAESYPIIAASIERKEQPLPVRRL